MSQFDGPIGKVRLGYKVAQTLGWRWVATRVYLEAEQRSGALERRTPPTTWDDYELEGEPWFDLRGLHPEAAGECLRAQPPEVEEELRQHLEHLKERRFDVFGTRVLIDDWHHDPIDNVSYPAHQHWSRVRELPDADVKLIWEPSRFSWAFDLARLHALDPSSPAPDIFWALLEDWCQANQPYQGVNWMCGQEAAVRFMAVAFAVKAFRGNGLTAQRQRLLAKFTDVTANRIKAHWRYAKSQDNNHIVSEAVGLVGCGLLVPGLRGASDSLALGQRLLRDACERLVFQDGGTSQYSSNYHRVFVDNLLWAVWLYRTAELSAPDELARALKRSADFLCAITNPAHGDMASYGHNDGTHLLPLATNAFDDVRSTLRLAAIAVGSNWLASPPEAIEAANWFWANAPCTDLAQAAGERQRVQIFEDAGISVIVTGGDRAVIRGGRQRFRSSQCDFGHVELWLDGDKVVTDLGTFNYKLRPGEPDLSLTEYHNAPPPTGGQQMTRLTRFLWADQPEVQIKGGTQSGDTLWSGEFRSRHHNYYFARSLSHDGRAWLVKDYGSNISKSAWYTPSTEGRGQSTATSPRRYVPCEVTCLDTVRLNTAGILRFEVRTDHSAPGLLAVAPE